MTTDHLATAPLAHADSLVLDYLAALWAATEDIEPALRDELMTTVADYIAVRRAGDDPAAVLHRLGPPGDLADAARRGRIPAHLRTPALPPAPRPPAAPPAPAADAVALGLLTAGSVFLPGAGPLAGTVVALASPRWTPAAKAAAGTLSFGSLLLSFFVLVAAVSTSLSFPGLVIAYVLGIAGANLAAVTLLPGFRNSR
ncbi:hypothetical protein [Symbioplanes lichenis]|uniref:hypothetical protein n=1 Tax=Symbioplanes lichenis TaxID=1629072 RepID=UPI002739F69C|nr:hypothetical protein [Actinoplanes lichenis]